MKSYYKYFVLPNLIGLIFYVVALHINWRSAVLCFVGHFFIAFGNTWKKKFDILKGVKLN